MLTRTRISRVALIALLAGTAWAQTATATLSGVIRDASSAVVPNAQVTVTNTDSGIKRTTTTDGEGRYALTNLLPGPY